jgi:hypothetical protein
MSLSLGVFKSRARRAPGFLLVRRNRSPWDVIAGRNDWELSFVEAEALMGLFFDIGGVSFSAARSLR